MRRAALLLLALSSASGCGDDDQQASLSFELAPVRADLPSGVCTPAAAPVPDDVDGLYLSICRYGGTGCEAVPLVEPGGDHATATPEILTTLDASRRLSVDGRLGAGPHRVEVVLCAGTTRVARGVADRVRLGADPVRVRLYRFDSVSCAGPRAGGGAVALPRALHELTTLPNGDILVYGGITGDAPPLPEAGMWRGAPLQRAIEVYRPSEERFLPVAVDGEFGRVLFAARLLPLRSEGEGPYVIRVVGGFTAAGEAAALRFDVSQGRTYHGSPILPSANATVADSVDLIYDPRGPSVRVEPAAIAGNPRGGGNRASELVDDLPAAVVLGIGEEDLGTPDSPRPAVVQAYWWLSPDGDRAGAQRSLQAGRYGHTVTAVPAAGAALLWGGNVAEASPDVVQATAGELLRPDPPDVLVGGGGLFPLPDPPAFHTATRVLESLVLVAGGLRVGCSGATCMGRGVSTTLVSPAVTAMRWEAGGFVAVPVDLAVPFTPAFLHTATPIDRGGRVAEVVLVGGATVSGTTRVVPSRQIVRLFSDVGRFSSSQLGGVPADGLIQGRWGHAVAPLPDDRLLVSGGLEIDGDGDLAAIAGAEVIAYGVLPEPNPCAGSEPVDAGAPEADAGGELDAGAPDAGPGPVDGGEPPDGGDAGS